ncbi:MAG: ABC transporter substrate-binding protein [Treponema sp.]|uniref:Extracellular ligand-binding receptor n=1 Tax=uncultured Spirochaetota bacterium TaxID=460511 RepID=A0A652ZUY1_9SPIR|nr:ABC transporter substrate-binding protein [Treponema sp.]VBB39598.1 Extracellular ligand-binding receptor [uncultured Spirochaetota bacterium]HOI22851.1 ABC transporter substrate-binding protein [Spirochaetales bacterium]
MRKRLVCVSMLMFSFVALISIGAASGPKEFKLGFMSSFTGTFAPMAENQRKGAELAVAEINARGGLKMPWGNIPVKLLAKDDECKLDVGVRRYRELVEAGIHGFTGICWNPMAAALNEESKLKPLPMITACVPAYDSFKKGNPAPGFFSVAFTPWSIGYLSGQSAVKSLNAKKIYFISRSDSWGSTIYDGLKAALAEFGGEVVGFAEYPNGNLDFTSAINQALTLKPDVFMAVQMGADAISLFKQAYDMGLMAVSKPFNTWTANYIAKSIPRPALAKIYALNFHYYDLAGFKDNDLVSKAKTYTDNHKKMFGGEPPDSYTSIAYMATTIMLDAVERAGTFDVAAVSKVLATQEFSTLKGLARFREDHELVNDYLAFMVSGKASGSSEWDLFKVEGSYGGDKALPSLSILGY